MSKPVRPDFFATVSLLSMSEGGRSTPLPHGEYRGVLALGQENFSFRTLIESEAGLGLGASVELGIQLLLPELGLPLLPIGKEFKLWEGKIIGKGKVIGVPEIG